MLLLPTFWPCLQCHSHTHILACKNLELRVPNRYVVDIRYGKISPSFRQLVIKYFRLLCSNNFSDIGRQDYLAIHSLLRPIKVLFFLLFQKTSSSIRHHHKNQVGFQIFVEASFFKHCNGLLPTHLLPQFRLQSYVDCHGTQAQLTQI